MIDLECRTCNYCNNQKCPYQDVPVASQRAWLQKQVDAGMPCWEPFPENIGVFHDETGRRLMDSHD